MIISCPACQTKYRLDERQINEDGAWLRCSRCRHVFFYTTTSQESESKEDIDLGEKEEIPIPQKTPRRRWILAPLLIVIVLIGLYFALYFPSEKPLLTLFGFGTSPESGTTAAAHFQIKVADLRQYFVENVSLGRIRIVQGSIVNTSNKTMTRIKVKGELYDMLGVRVMEGFAYCGNILTEQELATATEAEITKRLLQPLGTEVSTEKVPPQGIVPFMIVFLREPPGVEKTLVAPAAAEFLLP